MHLNSVWADVPLWWNSKEVKSAVELFSDQFAYRGGKASGGAKVRNLEL